MLGDPAVGKTSLVQRFVFDMFDEGYILTIGAKVVKKEEVIDGEDLKLLIWDLLGQDTFDHLVYSTLKGVEAVFIVFDLTRKNTLERIPKFMNIIEDTNPNIPLIILGNKNDLVSDIEVFEEDIQLYLEDHDYRYFTTSARTGENVELAFHELEKMILYQDQGE